MRLGRIRRIVAASMSQPRVLVLARGLTLLVPLRLPLVHVQEANVTAGLVRTLMQEPA